MKSIHKHAIQFCSFLFKNGNNNKQTNKKLMDSSMAGKRRSRDCWTFNPATAHGYPGWLFNSWLRPNRSPRRVLRDVAHDCAACTSWTSVSWLPLAKRSLERSLFTSGGWGDGGGGVKTWWVCGSWNVVFPALFMFLIDICWFCSFFSFTFPRSENSTKSFWSSSWSITIIVNSMGVAIPSITWE